jgi:hypothetical protein
MAVLASTTVADVLLALKIAFLVLLYLFVWRVIRSAGSDRRVPHEDSMILSPSAASAAGLGRGARPAQRPRPAHFVVQRSPSLSSGDSIMLDSKPLTIGRGGSNDVVLEGDEFASSLHARIEPRGDGVWVQDLESTNGTYVNGERVLGARRISPGDVLRVGETDLRLEEL